MNNIRVNPIKPISTNITTYLSIKQNRTNLNSNNSKKEKEILINFEEVLKKELEKNKMAVKKR